MAKKRSRTSKKRVTCRKRKQALKKSISQKKSPFVVSLRRCNNSDANSQVKKRLDSLMKKPPTLGKSQQEGGFIGALLAATAPLWLPLAVKGVKKIFH